MCSYGVPLSGDIIHRRERKRKVMGQVMASTAGHRAADQSWEMLQHSEISMSEKSPRRTASLWEMLRHAITMCPLLSCRCW